MSKALGAMIAVFGLGGLSMTLLTGVLGSFAECAALGVVGAGLTAASYVVGGRLRSPQVDGAPAAAPREARAS